MSKIRGKNTQPELMFRKALYDRGVRYRVNVKTLPGKPDIANQSKRFVVFIDLENMGYKVFRFWEFEIKKNLNDCVNEIVNFLNSN